MIGSLGSGIQQQQNAIVNPFQQKPGEQVQKPEEKKPEENRAQPKSAAAAGTQGVSTDTRQDASSVKPLASSDSGQTQGHNAQGRGSIVDITV